ncbi:MAG: hypothetical protein KAG99_06045 [Bacteroidales bacterium]|nr:hypothetical protein [Bacteroidales bacterium]
MKKLLLTLTIVILAVTTIQAQAPHAFKYQAIARDAAGNTLSIRNISLRISIIKEGNNLQAVFMETHNVQTNIYGLINLIIGEGEVVKGDFSSIKWGENMHYMKIEMDTRGGEKYKEVGTSQLYSVPYALYAEQAGKIAEDKNNTAKSQHPTVRPKCSANNSGGNRNGTPNSKFPADGDSYLNVNIGNVGIGTITPAVNLDIRSSSTASVSRILLGNSDNSTNLFLNSGHETANPYISFKGGTALRFVRYDGGINELMRIQSDGNVGIGTTDPVTGLHVDDTNGVLFTGTYGEGEIPVEGTGTRMMWYPAKAAFRVGRVFSENWDNNNIGDYSVALGCNTKANGNYSTAMGSGTNATGDYSTAIGLFTDAIGNYSIAMGGYTNATGNYSTAMGLYTDAAGAQSTALGYYTDAIGSYSTAMGYYSDAESRASVAMGRFNVGGGNPTSWVESDPLFEIGTGTSTSNRANALTVLKNGNVGIGTFGPVTGLHVDDTNGVLFTGTFGEGEIPIEGPGTRMIWYPAKGALRVGYVHNENWDNDSIGNYSVAMGRSTKAKGDYSTALGLSTDATGSSSTAMGYGTNATGKWSTAMGEWTDAASSGSVAIGRYNVGSGNPTSWVETDPLFEIGRGTSTSNRINALTVLKNGNVGIGTATPESRLDIQGNVTIRDISTGAIAIELGKGLDYAEGFNVTDKTNIEPGTILCIDPKNPGKLKISENPYDKTVAGIVAGANGLGSGVRLGTQEFDCDVALAGRVYCNTIATTENIEPGDLLTTSSIPGFAMKVTDFENAHGAILGKAMESLEKGKIGQILVLVTLQ